MKKLIKTVWIRGGGKQICPESEEMAELVPMKLKKKTGKCMVIEPEAVSKTNNALLLSTVKAHLWNRQLEEGKHASVRELSTTVHISMGCIQQIIRLNYLSHKIAEDILKVRQPSGLRLVDLREIPKLWGEQLEKFYGLVSSIMQIYYNRS